MDLMKNIFLWEKTLKITDRRDVNYYGSPVGRSSSKISKVYRSPQKDINRIDLHKEMTRFVLTEIEQRELIESEIELIKEKQRKLEKHSAIWKRHKRKSKTKSLNSSLTSTI